MYELLKTFAHQFYENLELESLKEIATFLVDYNTDVIVRLVSNKEDMVSVLEECQIRDLRIRH